MRLFLHENAVAINDTAAQPIFANACPEIIACEWDTAHHIHFIQFRLCDPLVAHTLIPPCLEEQNHIIIFLAWINRFFFLAWINCFFFFCHLAEINDGFCGVCSGSIPNEAQQLSLLPIHVQFHHLLIIHAFSP